MQLALIRTQATNMSWGLNYETMRRAMRVNEFPSGNSFIRLAGAILMDMNEEWITKRKYLRMEGLQDL